MFYSLILLTFLNPHGDGNSIVANSSALSFGGNYSTIESCEAAGKNTPEILINTGASDLYFTGTYACFQTVNTETAGAWLQVNKATQKEGLRFQVGSDSVTLAMADMSTCLSNIDAMRLIQPDWKLDDPIIIYGVCNAK